MKKLILILPLLYYSCDSDFQHGKSRYLKGQYDDAKIFLLKINENDLQYDEARELLSDINYKSAKSAVRPLDFDYRMEDKIEIIENANNLLDQIDTNYSIYATVQELKNKLKAEDLKLKINKIFSDSLTYFIDQMDKYKKNELKRNLIIKSAQRWYETFFKKVDYEIIDWEANVGKIEGDESMARISLEYRIAEDRSNYSGDLDVTFANGMYQTGLIYSIFKSDQPNLYNFVVNLEEGQRVIFSGKIKSSELTFNQYDEIRRVIGIKYSKIEVKTKNFGYFQFK